MNARCGGNSRVQAYASGIAIATIPGSARKASIERSNAGTLGSVLALPLRAYGNGSARAVVPFRVKSKRTTMKRWSSVSATGNCHFLAASIARRSK